MLYNMTWLERILFLKRKGGGTPAHEATSYTGSFFTDMVAPLKKLLLTLEPIQSGSGDPSPDNVRPISGHTECVTSVCGVNVWDEEWEAGGINTDGSLATNPYRLRSKNYISIIPNTAYYFASDVSLGYSSWLIMCFYDGDKNFVSFLSPAVNRTFNTPSNARFMKFCTSDAWNGRTYEGGFSINYPSTDTDYHAYQGNTYTTTLGRTVYGGTLDVVSGELVVDKGFAVFDGSETWTKNTRASNGFYTSRPQGCKQSTTMVSDKFINVDNVQDLYTTYGACFCGSSMNFNVNPETIGGDTIEDWKAWLADNPLQVVYELTSPQTYQLTPQQVNSLIGQNNIITDDGVEVSEVVYLTRLVGSPLLGSPQTEDEPTEEADEDPAEESETE